MIFFGRDDSFCSPKYRSAEPDEFIKIYCKIMIVFIKQLMNMSEKILQSKIRTKRGIVGYVNKEIDNIYVTCNI